MKYLWPQYIDQLPTQEDKKILDEIFYFLNLRVSLLANLAYTWLLDFGAGTLDTNLMLENRPLLDEMVGHYFSTEVVTRWSAQGNKKLRATVMRRVFEKAHQELTYDYFKALNPSFYARPHSIEQLLILDISWYWLLPVLLQTIATVILPDRYSMYPRYTENERNVLSAREEYLKGQYEQIIEYYDIDSYTWENDRHFVTGHSKTVQDVFALIDKLLRPASVPANLRDITHQLTG